MESNSDTKKVVAVSGGFDPLHIGHVQLLKEARRLGDALIVILNNDNWLRTKKGFVFMPEEERKAIIEAFDFVDRVVITKHASGDTDRSVVRELKRIKPDIFANGGDRFKDNIPEAIFCTQEGIKMVFNVGRGGKMQSSSWLTGKIVGKGIVDKRPWGYEEVLKVDPTMWVKTLTLSPGHRFSLQKHKYRDEIWVCVSGSLVSEINGRKKTLGVGDVVVAPKNKTHRLSSKKGGTIVEVAVGKRVVEDDFVRLEDDYGRS